MCQVETMRLWRWCSAIAALLLLAGCGLGLPNAQSAQSSSPAACENVAGACAVEQALTVLVTYLTLFAELCGALVIGVAVLRALLNVLPHLVVHRAVSETAKETIRLQLGRSLALALEFELGADILKTAVAPTFTIIAQLAAIIVLRTLLNYFLEREIRQSEERHREQYTSSAGQEVPHERVA